MIDSKLINKAVNLIAQEIEPQSIILFGSYARNNATLESDLDLLVVVDQANNKFKKIIEIRKLLRTLRLSADVVVVTQSELKEWGHIPGTVLYWALKEGKVIYEKAA